MGIFLSTLSRLMLIVILLVDLYLLVNIGVYYFKFDQLNDFIKPINNVLDDYPLYANIGFGVIVFICTMTAKRGLISILLFGAVGFALFNLYFLALI